MLYGYYTATCYFGLAEGHYMKFETEAAYKEYMEE